MFSLTSAHVPLPDIVWREGIPESTAFSDVYFSRAGGVAETEYVYLAANDLPQRFIASQHFGIGELGFGTGLNFLVAYRAFCAHAHAHATLHYLAVEKYPLTQTMLREALAAQPTTPRQRMISVFFCSPLIPVCAPPNSLPLWVMAGLGFCALNATPSFLVVSCLTTASNSAAASAAFIGYPAMRYCS